MQLRQDRRRRSGGRSGRRVLLVGFPPLTLSALEAAFKAVADVLSVPFPGSLFDRAAEEFDPDLVVVDTTYLDEMVVRPLISRRFHGSKSVVVYISESGQASSDGRAIEAAPGMTDGTIGRLVGLLSSSPLSLVAEQ
jgi:hypothetical protein